MPPLDFDFLVPRRSRDLALAAEVQQPLGPDPAHVRRNSEAAAQRAGMPLASILGAETVSLDVDADRCLAEPSSATDALRWGEVKR